MSKVTANMSVSLDGYVAGPNAGVDNPLGDGGSRLHTWAYPTASWRERIGLEGGQRGADDGVVAEQFDGWGAIVMGRRMFDEGEQPWGARPPFRVPVFVVTNAPREVLVREGGTSFTFVTEGIERALELAREAAGGKNVALAGGADTIRQFLHAGLLDELALHVAPVVLGGGTRLLDGIDPQKVRFEKTRVVETPLATHVTLRVVH